MNIPEFFYAVTLFKDAAAKGKKACSLSESYPGARPAFQVFKYQ